MFIKEINITGFRSYRELTTVKDFSQKHNVVVGRNGSGKSNFFYAIQFVLSNEYSSLNQEQRNNILHEGTGNRSTLAKVEIIFDNTDRRIPSDSNEVRIIRQVGQKKDQYFIDTKVVSRTDIVNLMESVGFSRSNPYYIVKQGKITELATAADSYRLQLIREVAGTRVFDEKKEDSLKILTETQSKIEKSSALLNSIENSLKKLEEEKEDLKEYQKWDKMKRAIEYTIYDMEIKETRSKCDKLAAQREQINAQQNSVESELITTKLALQNVETDIRKLDIQYKGKKEERKLLADQQAECLQKKTQLELYIKDLKDDVARERNGRALAEENLVHLRNEIHDKEEQVARLAPRYTELVEQESRLFTDVRIAEQKCKELGAKRGHMDQFRSIEERDRHLKREINFFDRQLAENKDRVNDIMQSIEEDGEEVQRLQNNMGELELKVQESLTKIESLSSQSRQKKQELDQAISVQMDYAREEKQIREQYATNQYDISQAEQDLQRLTSKAIINGINSVKTVLAQLEERRNAGSRKLIDGCVIDLFECDSKYYKAIEVTAEGRLFFHVVEDDQVATTLLNFINEQDLRGEINFYPLNRIVAKSRKTVNDPEARPMLTEMRYDEKFDAVFTSIFADAVFVRNLIAGSRVSKSENVNCVTLEGDQVSRRGPMTGGFIDVKKSKLELAKTIRNLKKLNVDFEEKIEEYSEKTNDCTSRVEKIRLELNKIEMDRATLSQEHRLLTDRARSTSEQINQLLMNREPKSAQLLQLRSRIREIEARKQTFASQLGSPLNSQITSQDQNEIDKLQNEIREKKVKLEKIRRERMVVENNKLSLENQLQSNLLKKRENLTAKIQDISVEEMRHTLTSELAEVKVINERIDKILAALSELDESLAEYENEKEALTTQLESLQEQKSQLSAQIDEFAKNADVFCTKISSIQAKREESLRKMRDMGSLPTDALGRYQNHKPKQLGRMLTECMNELKKYENVNRKALDQFVQTSQRKDELAKRVEELSKNETAIKDLLEVLENRRYETLQLTFKQVAKNFHDVFKKLIPYGHADLVMKTSDALRNNEEPMEKRHIMESFIGIGIQVSFTGSSETREMSHLSGGQKSLVALALIFAIQKCDPAPFYLFDEIDAALDPEHRKSVADMIHELSENAQFITTTFRPELLEHAEKFYGVRFRNKGSYLLLCAEYSMVSYIDVVTREQAYDFIQDDQTHS